MPVNVIAVPNQIKQKQVLDFLEFKLNEVHHTDVSITVAKQLTRISVLQMVKGKQIVAAVYHVIIVPISVNLDNLKGFNSEVSINIKPLLTHLDTIKANILSYMGTRKVHAKQEQTRRDEFAEAAKRIFGVV